ncbi:hypothetical protein HQ346_22290 [Rhodococcus sp. BP-252]|uniref:zinc ribbon domain-containing protein n=1 Tax=unclassified Rhodococcus (in: high G+C Gram-positive bacteria) TaxID=192944 RepID=UPI001C9BAD90|nr:MULTISPECIES: zinc ribbon domain-containing protein [unclassified Rhodococcus (in: high G+C Gram-positive bacteria)]MBY6414394.1 hypothetical protein [Rhodococcus sp. BP-320]MBY6419531.1 hypothetical protein [Rhodococcus sp. BP-321]MBY6424028.1 hypothetical protein [Rhodococcus sp. BP-324]MBY6429239.1 hypothetical protein [Rhodococcus sp. BP-323]MBY6434198.1 hypothetical protein [Rhodococcus sp. BP-322]
MTITMQRCTTCAAAVFPPRPLCPHCHNSLFEPATAHRGVIEETSLQRGTPPVLYATIRTDLGPTVVGKVVGEGGIPGAEIDLVAPDTQRTGGPMAVVPQPTV